MSESGPCQHGCAISAELQIAIKAAFAAGQRVRDGYQQLSTIQQKGVGDLVSQVDRDADQAACELLQSESSLPILSEELHCDQTNCEDMWIVDPLDGTAAFLMQAGREYPSVLVAMRQSGKTHLGVVYFPLTDEWFYAQRGRGAWHDGRRLVCDDRLPLSSAWVEMNQFGDSKFETPLFASLRNRLRSQEGARLVTLNFAYSGVATRIASGTSPLAVAIHDNNPSYVKQAPWDIAAPQIVLEEAGGVFLTPSGQRTDPFSPEPIIVARSRRLAEQVLDLVREHDCSSI